MSKVTLTNLVNLQNETTAVNAINANSAAITTAMDNTLSRDGTSPNQMNASLDMNSKHILNLPQPLQATEPLRYQDLNSFVHGGTVSNIPAGGLANNILIKNSNTDFDVSWASQGSIFVGQALTRTNDTNVTVTLGGTPSQSVLNAVSLTLGWSGTLSAVRGGFGTDMSAAAGVSLWAAGVPTMTGTTGTNTFVRSGTPTIATPNFTTSFSVDSNVFGSHSTNYHILSDPAGVQTFQMGNATDPTNYQTNTIHNFRSRDTVNPFLSISIGGLTYFGSTSGSIVVKAPAVASSGTLTLPIATDTLIGKATTDTLTNKTFDTAGTGNSFRVNGFGVTASTGIGSTVVLDTNAILVTPTLGVATATTINKVTITQPAASATLTIANTKTLTVSNTLTFTGTDGTSFAFPSTSDTVATLTATQTLANKTLTAPIIAGGTSTSLTSLGIRSTGTGAFDLTLANTENLTAARTLTLTVNNAARIISLSGNLTLAADFITAGGNSITLTGVGVTNVTLPGSGTLATRDTSNTFSSTNTFSSLTQFTDIKLSSGKIYPLADGTTALQITKADGTTRIVNVDTTNARVGINKNAGAFDLDTNGAVNVGGRLTFSILDGASLQASPSTITDMTIQNSPSASLDYIPYYNAASGQWRRGTVGAIASGATAGVAALNGLTGSLNITVGSGLAVSVSTPNILLNAANPIPGGRITLGSGIPVLNVNSTGAGTIYYTPYLGNTIPIYDGTNFILTTFAEVSQLLTNNTKSPAAAAASSNYDMFVWNDAGTVRVSRGFVWTSDTARGTGAGTTELQLVNGIWTNKIAITNGPIANKGTYVGTIRTNAGATVDWTFGSIALNWSPGVFNVWNMYNRVWFTSLTGDTADNWTHTVATTWRAANGNTTTARHSFVRGMDEDAVTAEYKSIVAPNSGTLGVSGVGLDTTTSFTGTSGFTNSTQQTPITPRYAGLPGIGAHFVSANEWASNTGGTTWYGDGSIPTAVQTGMWIEFWA